MSFGFGMRASAYATKKRITNSAIGARIASASHWRHPLGRGRKRKRRRRARPELARPARFFPFFVSVTLDLGYPYPEKATLTSVRGEKNVRADAGRLAGVLMTG